MTADRLATGVRSFRRGFVYVEPAAVHHDGRDESGAEQRLGGQPCWVEDDARLGGERSPEGGHVERKRDGGRDVEASAFQPAAPVIFRQRLHAAEDNCAAVLNGGHYSGLVSLMPDTVESQEVV